MAKSKFFWLRLQRDFFKRHDIQIIEAMPNGKDYILFYLKLLCESVDHDGNLRFSDEIPYSDNMLATITNTNIDVVRAAIKVFTELKMMELLDDGTFYMNEVQKMLGSACQDDYTRESTRLRVQAFRERKKQGQIEEKRYSNVTCNGEIELEKEKEIELEINKEKDKRERVDYQQIADMYNDTCVSFPRITTLSDSRKKAIKARLNTYTLEDLKTMFEKAEKSDFLKGSNSRNWTASFDWLIKDANMAKVLDGNYDNKAKQTEKPQEDPYPNFFV